MHHFQLKSFPRAILHVDGDSFFASCEVALNPALRGRPVITGKERGIVSAMTYEAKARGVTRGMTLGEVRRVCPDAVILPSDYETYALFSQRMYNIVRRYTPDVEEYSIDECFADLTGLRATLRMPYQKMAESIQRDLVQELGMTFSVGLAPTKVLAKVASKWKKPNGLTFITGKTISHFLEKISIEKVWGIGPNTAAYLQKLGIHNPLQLALKSLDWVEEHLSKPYQEIWYELRGYSVNRVNTVPKREYQSISKTRTFTPASADRSFIFSQLSKNVENACIKARRHGLASAEISFFLKTQEFRYHTVDAKLSRPESSPVAIMAVIKDLFDQIYRKGELYRASGITLRALSDISHDQLDLFNTSQKVQALRSVYTSVDKLAKKYGKHTVFLASSMRAMNEPQHTGGRQGVPMRKSFTLPGENARKRLALPFLGEVV